MNKEKSTEAMLTIAMGFLLLFFIFGWHWTLIVSFVVGLIGIFSTWLSMKITWLWFGLAKILGKVVNTILLTVVFCLFLTPIALLFRIFNKDPLLIKKGYDSYFITRDITFDKVSFEKPW